MTSTKSRKFARNAAIVTTAALMVGACCESDGVFRLCEGFDKSIDSFTNIGLPQSEPTEAEVPAANPSKGDVLVLGGGLNGGGPKSRRVEFFDSATRKFALAGESDSNRLGAPAVTLRQAKAPSLAAGGAVGSARYDLKSSTLSIKAKALDTAEIYDQRRETAKPLAAEMSTERVFHTETVLKDGRVLIVGGFDSTGEPLFSADIYNPETKTFMRSGILQSRALHTATLLKDGRVFIAGGVSSIMGDANGTTEIFDPETGNSSFASDEFMQSPDGPIRLAGHTATLIEGCDCDADGKILIVGGFTGQSLGSSAAIESSVNVAMLYDGATRSFNAIGTQQLNDERLLHTATPLPGGKVLLTGGVFGQARFGGKKIVGLEGGVHDTAEIYDPVKNTMTCVGGTAGGGKGCKSSMQNTRAAHAAPAITSGPLKGHILLVGGAGTPAPGKPYGLPLKSAELFDPETGKFTAVGAMKTARLFPTAVEAK